MTFTREFDGVVKERSLLRESSLEQDITRVEHSYDEIAKTQDFISIDNMTELQHSIQSAEGPIEIDKVQKPPGPKSMFVTAKTKNPTSMKFKSAN